MGTHVFTYGSLMFGPVWKRVVRGSYRHVAATLDGHARHPVTGTDYPGMIAQHGASVAGVLYLDVMPDDVARLDVFEGSEYRRDRVRVRLASGELAYADTYLYLLPHNLANGPWLPEEFALQRFLQIHCSAPDGTV